MNVVLNELGEQPVSAYDQGKVAFREGKTFVDNQHPQGTKEHRDWYCGWHDEEERHCETL